ncbi:unnamed protein product [Gadus morhua 'NCC']
MRNRPARRAAGRGSARMEPIRARSTAWQRGDAASSTTSEDRQATSVLASIFASLCANRLAPHHSPPSSTPQLTRQTQTLMDPDDPIGTEGGTAATDSTLKAKLISGRRSTGGDRRRGVRSQRGQ